MVKKRWMKILVGALGTLGVLAGLVLGGFYLLATKSWPGRPEPVPFERAAWLHGTNRAQGSFPRMGMAEYMMAHQTFYGMTKKELLQNLGEPDGRDQDWHVGERNRIEHLDLMYYLGPNTADSDWLGVKFDQRGRVAAYVVVSD